MTEQTMRCFIGVPVDHHVALALLDLRDQALSAFGQAQVRPVPARNFHLTLAFLGGLAPAQRAALAAPLAELARCQRSFLQPLDIARVFPSAGGAPVGSGGAAGAGAHATTAWGACRVARAARIASGGSATAAPCHPVARRADLSAATGIPAPAGHAGVESGVV